MSVLSADYNPTILCRDFYKISISASIMYRHWLKEHWAEKKIDEFITDMLAKAEHEHLGVFIQDVVGLDGWHIDIRTIDCSKNPDAPKVPVLFILKPTKPEYFGLLFNLFLETGKFERIEKDENIFLILKQNGTIK